jgi:hypothetical protein
MGGDHTEDLGINMSIVPEWILSGLDACDLG